MYIQEKGTNANASFSAWYKISFTDTTTSGTNYFLTRIAEVNVSARKVYALDVDDVIAYLGSNSTPQDVNELFWNQRSYKPYDSSTDKGYVWLRSAPCSASLDYSRYAFFVNGDSGYLSLAYSNDNYEIRPAFVIDLSLLS